MLHLKASAFLHHVTRCSWEYSYASVQWSVVPAWYIALETQIHTNSLMLTWHNVETEAPWVHFTDLSVVVQQRSWLSLHVQSLYSSQACALAAGMSAAWLRPKPIRESQTTLSHAQVLWKSWLLYSACIVHIDIEPLTQNDNTATHRW